MHHLPDDQRHHLTILILVALKKLGGSFQASAQDIAETKGQNFQVVSNGKAMEVEIWDRRKHGWPKLKENEEP